MGKVLISGSGGGGATSDDLTADLNDVVKGKTAVTVDSDDEAGTGTLELTGNAAAGDVIKGQTFYTTDPHSKTTGTLELTGNAEAKYVYSGKTFYSNNPKSKLTGSMSVSSVVSFSIASVTGVTFTLKWKNPSRGPYGGVIIRVKEGSYPTSVSDGTQAYKGTGTNKNLNGDSTCTWTAAKQSTRYYFRIWMYCDTSQGTLYSGYKEANGVTGTVKGTQTFKSSGTFTVPAGVYSVQYFIVGGGAGGNGCYHWAGYQDMGCYRDGTGGGSGYTRTGTMSVSPGQRINVTIGAGGNGGAENAKGTNGGSTSFGSQSVGGGTIGYFSTSHAYANIEKCGGNGGSGGGAGYEYVYVATGGGSSRYSPACAGASDGANAEYYDNSYGKGQGSTTRAWGQSGQTLYAGGGGGGGDGGQAGGAGGGGRGAGYSRPNYYAAVAGTANTGGGGGGGHDGRDYASSVTYYAGAKGGSGIVLVRWGY